MTPRTIILLVLVLFSCHYGNAQTYTVKGKLSDTLNFNPLPNAAVTLIRSSDSVMATFARAKEDGSFQVHPSATGKYIIMITFPGFADFLDVVNVENETPVDLGEIPMISKTNLLKEFVFTQQVAAIKIKGDTTEYVADSFLVKENATVEELLKRLPGIQVHKDGSVVAQGEKVQKILVDGEEFFTDDPAVVTKSLQAKAVDKVQVFNKKSDQAEFTGIDDGEKTKTINLQLKDNMKRGYFGRLDANGGAGENGTFFDEQVMVNAFRGKRKLSAFGIVSNTGTSGLGWEDRDKFGGGNNFDMDDNGNYYSYNYDEFSSWDGRYNGQGLPKVWTGGLHYSNKWNEDKQHFSTNYRYAKQNIETIGNTFTQNILPDSQYFSNQDKKTFSSAQRHRGDGTYEWKIDSLTSVRLTANANFTNTKSSSDYDGESLNEDYRLVSTSDRDINSDATAKSINSNLLFRKKFNKKSRTLSINLSENYTQSSSDAFFLSTNTFLDESGTLDSTIKFDQHKLNNSENLSVSSNITYTEPLSKLFFLELSYALRIDNNEADRKTYDRMGFGDYSDVANPFFSSSYVYDVMGNTGGTALSFADKKVKFSVGAKATNTAFSQTDKLQDTSFKYSFNNYYPQANFSYQFNRSKSFSIRYNGSTNQPRIEQIQPLRDNTDPLNIAVGNPSLTQEFRHRVNINFNNYKALTGSYTYAGGGGSYLDNAISRSENVIQGRKEYQFINVDGNYNAYLYGGYGYNIKKINLQMGFNTNINFNHSINYINGTKNISDFNSYSIGLDIEYETADEKFQINLNPRIAYNDNRATVSTQASSYWNSDNEFSVSYEFPLKFEAGSSINWFLRERTQVFDRNNNVFKWDAYVSKKLLKNDQLEIRVSVADILNQNLGFSRNAQNNYIMEDNYNTIRRYGLLRVIWNFTKSPLNAPADETLNIN